VFGIAAGKSVTDLNCERIKLSKTVYDMGMKVAAVSLMCQDKRVFQAMEMAGTPCPFEGKIGVEAAAAWEAHVEERPDYREYIQKISDREKKVIALAKAEERSFVKECKKTRHPEGTILRDRDVSGLYKSGSTCRKEWSNIQQG
jgi:hypothetical protein